MKLSRRERFELGIQRFGYDSNFRKEVEKILTEEPFQLQGNLLDELYDKHHIPQENENQKL